MGDQWTAYADAESSVGLSPARTSPPSPRPGSGQRRRDSLSAVLGPGESSSTFYTGVTVALTAHVAVLCFANLIGLFGELRLAVDATRARLNEYFWAQYEVDLAPKAKPEAPKPPEEPPPPPPEPVAAPAPLPKAEAKPKDDPYDQPPPTPAQAAKVLTAKEEPDEVKDLTNTTVSGDGNAVGGMQSAAGTGDKTVMNTAASLKGQPGGTGTAPAPAPPPPPPPGPDLSRPISLGGSKNWDCPFPPEADTDQIDQAVVTIQVTVRPDGSVQSVSILSDPGHGFGRAAKTCAMGKHFSPALDRTGTAFLSSSPMAVRFRR